MKRGLIAGAVIAVAIAVALVVGGGRRSAPSPSPSPSPRAAEGEAARAGEAPIAEARPAAVAPVAKAAIDRARRTEIAGAIAASRRAAQLRRGSAAAGAAGGAATAGSAAPIDDTPGVLTKDEIRTGVRAMIPMLTDCYATEIERDPRLAGEVIAQLGVDSEPDLGMVVTVGDLTVEGTLGASAEFRDCVSATLEAVVLPPLPEGGHVDITYPFAFSNNPDPPAEAAP